MNDFTFIVLSYNQEAFIESHLESIKRIVTKYSNGRVVDLIIADDCSSDKTVEICKKWLFHENTAFNNVRIISRDKNLGVVHNLLDAISKVRTTNFKFLAGDDTYSVFDIFSVCEKYHDKILITKVNVFGADDKKRKEEIESRFRVLDYMSKRNKVSRLVSMDNYIAAPGVFVPGYMLKNKEFYDFMDKYKNIEDYPMWMYLLVKKKYDVVVDNSKLINYRIGNGMSNAENSPTRKLFLDEKDYVNKSLGAKCYSRFKYLNIYKYYMKLLRIITKIEND